MSFGPESTNPRERRAYAHTKLSQLKQGEATYEETIVAVKAASPNRKGKGFTESLGKSAVVLVDWGATSFVNPGVVHHNFGGYVMPKSETERWTTLRAKIEARKVTTDPRDRYESEDQVLRDLYNQNNQKHGGVYPTAKFTRIFRGQPSIDDQSFPQPGQVINPAAVEDIMPFIGWDEQDTVQSVVNQLPKNQV